MDNYEVTELVFDPPKNMNVPVIQHTDWEHSLSRDLLGWQPKYTIEEGLKKTVEWFKDNLWRY
jgi:nucleoside-diphosphate-sugar epimerase